MSNLLPWQDDLWRGLMDRARTDTLPHALLMSGMAGIGKADFAARFARAMLCQSPQMDGQACGQCGACQLLQAGTHPDLRVVEPEEEGKNIPVDEIRAVGEFLGLKAQYGGRQVVIIQPAEAMNRFSANSLLKTLEEPSPHTLLILVSHQPSQLLPTIRSRCQQIHFPRPEPSRTVAWLKDQIGESKSVETLLALADGAPLAALRLHEEGGLAARQDLMGQWSGLIQKKGDPLAVAAAWGEWGMGRTLQWLSSWVADMIRLKSGAAADAISNRDLAPSLAALANGLELKVLYAYLDRLTDYARWRQGQMNEQLALEDLMIQWAQYGPRSRQIQAQ
jgi:DNA polymerase-3 subunit delta'